MGYMKSDGLLTSESHLSAEELEIREKERISSHTYHFKIRNFNGVIHAKNSSFRAVSSEQMDVSFAVEDFPRGAMPSDVSFVSFRRSSNKAGQYWIKGSFNKSADGSWQASEDFLNNLEEMLKKTRENNKIIIGSDIYHFPVVDMEYLQLSDGSWVERAKALVNGQEFPLKRNDDHWVLNA